MKFFIKDFYSKYDQNPQYPPDSVTFTKKVFNENFRFLCSPGSVPVYFPSSSSESYVSSIRISSHAKYH